MADSISQYLHSIFFNTQGVPKVIKDAKDVEAQLLKTAGAVKSIQTQQVFKSGDLIGKQVTKTFKSGLTSKELIDPNTGDVLKRTFSEISTGSGKAISQMNDFDKAIRRVAIVVPIWAAMRLAMQAVTGVIQTQTKFLVDLENAMAQIKVVGQGTDAEFKTLKNTLVALSFAYGVSSAEALKAATIFAQQGKTAKETGELTRVAMVGAIVLGQDIGTVVNNLTAAAQAFNIPVSDAISIVDKWINVERQFAVTAADLADATKTAGATANQMGITISEFLGNVTAVIEVTRQSGSEAANGLKFLYARLDTTAKNTIQQITQIPFYLNAVGEATNIVTAQSRPLEEILGALAGKWESLTISQKKQIAQAVGSKRQMQTLFALMQNFDRSIEANISSMTSAGQSYRAFLINQDTVKIKTEQLNGAMNNLTLTVANTSAWKSWIDTLKDVVIGFTAMIDRSSAFKALAAEEVKGVQARIDAQKAETASIIDLVKARDGMLKQPQTPKTIANLTILNDAIANISKNIPEIKLAIDKKGTIDDLKIAQQNVNDRLAATEIKLKVGLEFDAKKIGLEQEIEKLNQELAASFIPGLGKISPKIITTNIKSAQQEINNLSRLQTVEANKQIAAYKAQELVKKNQLTNDIDLIDNAFALTESEKEQLAIETEIAQFKILNNDNTEEAIRLNIELIKNAKFIEDKHKQNQQLAKLENDLTEEKIKKTIILRNHEIDILKIQGASGLQIATTSALLAKQASISRIVPLEKQLAIEKEITSELQRRSSTIEDLAIQFEKAQTPDEKNKIRRQIEFVASSPNDQLFELNRATGDLRQELLDSLRFTSEQTQKAFAQSIISNNRLPQTQSFIATDLRLQADEFARQEAAKIQTKAPTPITTTIQKLEVNVTADLAKTKEEALQSMINSIEDAVRGSKTIDEIFNEKIEKF